MTNQKQRCPWRTGNPPEPGWYLVTVELSEYSRYVMQGFYSPDYSYWKMGDEFTGIRDWPRISLGLPLPVTAWMPLPEPYRGE